VFLADTRRSDAACTVKMLDFGIAFRRCVAMRGSDFHFTVQPVEPQITIRARLAGTR
jgi:hypothetical protein